MGPDIPNSATHTGLRAIDNAFSVDWADIPVIDTLRNRWLAAGTMEVQQAICRKIQVLY